MRIPAVIRIVAIVALATGVSLAAQTTPKTSPAKPKMPPAIEVAFTTAYPRAVVKNVSKEAENGVVQYELETVDGATKRDLIYLTDGTLVVDETTIAMSDVPAPVLAALKTRYPKATVTLYERLTKPSGVSYEMQLKGVGVAEAEIAPDGTFISPKPIVKKDLFPMGFGVGIGAPPAGPYAKIADIHIGGAGGFDYLTPDPANHRVYVSHSSEVVVIDTATNTVVGKIGPLTAMHGIAVAPTLGQGFITEGRGGNKIAVFDLTTLAITDRVAIAGTPEANPDAILYEPTKQQVWSFNHTGKTVTVIDAKTHAIVATAALSGTAETGQADASIGKVFINIEDTDSIDVVDMATDTVIANYKVAPASSPTGMAVDAATHHLFVGGGDALVMMDTRTGKVIASSPICKGTDATWYDPSQKMAFVSCSDGHITAINVSGNTLSVAQTIDTARGARTMALDATTHRLYTAAVTYAPADPSVPNARPVAVPDSFHVLVFAPGK